MVHRRMLSLVENKKGHFHVHCLMYTIFRMVYNSEQQQIIRATPMGDALPEGFPVVNPNYDWIEIPLRREETKQTFGDVTIHSETQIYLFEKEDGKWVRKN